MFVVEVYILVIFSNVSVLVWIWLFILVSHPSYHVSFPFKFVLVLFLVFWPSLLLCCLRRIGLPWCMRVKSSHFPMQQDNSIDILEYILIRI